MNDAWHIISGTEVLAGPIVGRLEAEVTRDDMAEDLTDAGDFPTFSEARRSLRIVAMVGEPW